MTTSDHEQERPDDRPASSASITRATDLMYHAATGNPPPPVPNARYDKFREAVAAMCNAASVGALRKLHDGREAQRRG